MASEFEAVANAGTQGWPRLARPANRLLRALPGALELACVAAVLVLLWPLFQRAAGFGLGRDARFAGGGLEVAGLPPAVLPAVCGLFGSLAEPVLVERLCGALPSTTGGAGPATHPAGLPLAVQRAASATRQALLAPLAEAQQQRDALRARQGDGDADLRPVADAIGVLESRIEPYAARFRLAGDGSGPAPLECALRAVDAALAGADATPAPARANALLLLGGALDGRPATAALAATAALPSAETPAVAGCVGMAASLGSGASLVGEARQSASAAAKNAAMRDLLGTAGWQWAGAMALGFAFLRASRWPVPASAGVGAALLAWALAGWAARVPWPLAAGRDFQPARLDAAWGSPPAGFIVGLGAAGLVLLLAALALPRDPTMRRPRQALSTRVGFAGLAAATGIGWLLLLDLSAHAHPVNRYLALYHQGHLWLGMLVFSVLLFLRVPLGRSVGWALSVVGEAGRRLSASTGRFAALVLLGVASLAALVAVGLALSNMRQLTSELGRIWLIVGGAWFFFLRGGPLAERMARSGSAAGSFVRYVAPLGFVVAMLLGAMLVTRDMGPLLIAGYAAGGFVAATLASWWHQRNGGIVAPSIAALLLFAGWIGGVTLALFQLGNVDAVTAARLESLAAPFASTNDQLALVTWFQHAAPPDGFGLGNAPWCGYAAGGGCSGVPAQVHSDYTFTALVGVFGAAAGWVLWLGCALWLHRLVRHHGRVTGGEPRLVASGGRLVYDGQGLLSWVCVGWVVLTLCQLAVTVAGNLAVLPLTGVTFPFVSFGMTSLVVNLAFLALCLNLSVPDRRPRHG